MDVRYRVRESLTAVLFLIVMGALTVLWLYGRFVPEDAYAGMEAPSKARLLSRAAADDAGVRAVPTWAVREEPPESVSAAEGLELLAEEADGAINTAMDRSHLFIQFYGGIQRALGRRVLEDVAEENTVYKLSDGSLAFIRREPAQGLESRAISYLIFERYLEKKEIPLLYLQAPQKIGGEGAPSLPEGVADYGNQDADRFLALLEEWGCSTLDLRQVLSEEGQLWTSWFYATDHHWTPEAAMLCVRAVGEHLNETYDLELDLSLTDRSEYTVEVYENFFLGSQGKRSGSLYAGLDDFTVWIPDFKTDFTYEIYPDKREGSFEETLLFPEQLEEEDLFQANPYTVYSGGDFPFTRITNHLNPDGPKIMLLRDSFGCAFAPFLALYCSELTTVDLRYFHDYFPTYINWIDPEYVLMLYSPGCLDNDMAFNFFSLELEEEGEAAQAEENAAG